ncbi:hypothetical protein ACOZFM_37075 [Streptomyces arboris]|uniref:hypothetical protein n=1 Tax=Streptomyces arboris TaxID=2600619 RepID=UPI003BF496D4
MILLTGLKSADRFVTLQAGLRIPAHAGRVLSLVEEAAESSKLWCVAAAAMAVGVLAYVQRCVRMNVQSK